MKQQIAEIGDIERAQPILVGRVDLPRAAVGEVGILGRRHARRRETAILPALDQAHHRRRNPAFGVQPAGLHHLLQHTNLVVAIEDVEAARQPHELRVPAQHSRAERMERAEPEPLRRPRQQCADTLTHLAGGAVGECHREHLIGEPPCRPGECARSGWSARASCRSRRLRARATGHRRFRPPRAARD